MGAGASAGVKAALGACSQEDLKAAMSMLDADAKEKLQAALAAEASAGDKKEEPKEAGAAKEEPKKEDAKKEEPKADDAKEEPKAAEKAPTNPFIFDSGLPDCCSSNPESYSVVAEMPNARLVQMKVPPGGEDKPHEHPPHSMYFVTDAKLCITDYPDGKTPGEPHTVEIPKGAAPIFPAGAHQVKNVGDSEVIVIFVEAYPTCQPCGDVDGFVTPFCAAPQCYKVHTENDDWITGEVNMEPGAKDDLHNHKDHLIYVLEGDEVTIYPEGDMDKGHAVPIKPFAGIPAPISAGPIFSKHVMKNSGTKPIKMVFFEMKK